jgi:hypothetical protein
MSKSKKQETTEQEKQGRMVPVGNRMKAWTSTKEPEDCYKSFTDKATAISSFRRHVSYYSKRNLPLPKEHKGLSEQECKDLLTSWGF